MARRTKQTADTFKLTVEPGFKHRSWRFISESRK